MQLNGQAKLAVDSFQSQMLQNIQKAVKGEERSDEDKVAAAEGFEKMFAKTLVSELRKTISNGLFAEGAGSDVYTSWFDDHLSNVIAEQKALGIGELMFSDLGTITPDDLAELDDAHEDAQ